MPQPEPRAHAAGYSLVRDAELAALTTFRVPARAAWLAEVAEAGALPAVLTFAVDAALPVLVLGGGSNLLFTRDYPGFVVRIANRGFQKLQVDSGATVIRIAAGESWDSVVRRSLARGLFGLENLILIPGSVGAAPIQNIGAYGAELSEFVSVVEAWDCDRRELVRLDPAACAFGYRDSIFKRVPGRYLVTALELRLAHKHDLRLDYAGLREELAATGVEHPQPMDVARAVERLRLRKLPNPAEIGNAGSFFKNPIVTREQGEALKARHPGFPVYPAGVGKLKLSAAWLIEACGFKGHHEGDAGVSEKHALVLVNYGGASGAQIWALAERIRDTVARRFGLVLEPEPLII